MNRKDKKILTGRFQIGIGRKSVGCEWTHQSGSARTALYLLDHVGGTVRLILKIILQFSHGKSTKKDNQYLFPFKSSMVLQRTAVELACN
jgi:hypothetical protein